MKKIMIMFVIMLFSASAFAAVDGSYMAADTTSGADLGGDLSIKGSKSVLVAYKVSGSPYDGYIIAAYHNKGNKTYASSSHDTKVYRADATAQAISSMTAPTGTDGSVTWTSGTWTAM